MDKVSYDFTGKELPEELRSLFRVCDCGGTKSSCSAHYLIGTIFLYNLYLESWHSEVPGAANVSFEHVLDSVDEETQTQLLFHLDYFLGEVKDDT